MVGIAMTNLFAFRATDKNEMFSHDGDKVGPENDKYLEKWHKQADKTVVAWGEHGSHENRAKIVLQSLGTVYCLTKLANGQPGHPLFKKADLKPQIYKP